MCWQLPRCAGQVTHVSIEQSAAVSDEQCGPTFEHTWRACDPSTSSEQTRGAHIFASARAVHQALFWHPNSRRALGAWRLRPPRSKR